MQLKHILPDIKNYKSQNQILVLVTGVFDILHQEHLNFLNKAKSLGDILIVGIESDIRVRAIKGEGRPINPQDIRFKNLQDTCVPDLVFILPDKFSKPEDHQNLIKTISPDFLAVSSHTSHQKQKRDIIEKFGGQLKVVHQHNPNISTTKSLQNHN